MAESAPRGDEVMNPSTGSIMRIRILSAAFLALAFVTAEQKAGTDVAPATASKVLANSVSTFHCLSIYWSPENGEAQKKVLVKFREAGVEGTWRDGLPMRYNPVKTTECK